MKRRSFLATSALAAPRAAKSAQQGGEMVHFTSAFCRAMITTSLRCLALVALMATISAQGALAEPFTIMTQNMDEGTDYSALASAHTLGAFIAAVTQTYQEIEATQPDARAGAIANEIASEHPDLVALQEASIVRTGVTPPATTVTSDLLGALVNQLAVLGQHYAPVVIGTEFDAEAPSTLGFDVRLTTQDVILARTDLPSTQFSVSNPQAHQYATQLTTHSPVGPISLTRGWASVDAKLDGTSFRFVTTHLDTGLFSPAIQFAQAQELLSSAGNTTLPVIYAGDFNSSADDPSDPTFPTYKSLIDSGLGDAWNAANPGDPGFTCCEAPDLLNADPMLTQRIDLALFAGPFGVDDAHLVGISGSDKVDGLWPSDHAGLVVTFDVPVPEPASMSLFVLGIGALAAARRRGPR